MAEPAASSVVRKEVLAFAIPGVLLLGLLALFSIWGARQFADRETVRDAVTSAQETERLVIAPHLEAGLADGDPQAVAELDTIVRERLLRDPTVTVRLWSGDGTVVYSDKPQLIGQRFALGDEEQEVLANGGTEAEVSDLTKPENRFETVYGQLIEVYLPTTGKDGTKYLLEIYQRQEVLDARTREIVIALLPTILGALAVLAAILLLLAWRMVRRLDRDRQQREDLLMYAVNASEAERRRIAADLHDGVVQDLVGVTFGLSAMAHNSADPAAEQQLSTAADRTRKAVGSLRTLLVDIYPPNLADSGLAAALEDLAAGMPCEVSLDLKSGLQLHDRCQQVFYRVAREATQNIVKHARADHAKISLRRDGDLVTMVVGDDGVGFETGRTADSGHVGLALVQDLAAQVDADLAIDSETGKGTTVTFTMRCPR